MTPEQVAAHARQAANHLRAARLHADVVANHLPLSEVLVCNVQRGLTQAAEALEDIAEGLESACNPPAGAPE